MRKHKTPNIPQVNETRDYVWPTQVLDWSPKYRSLSQDISFLERSGLKMWQTLTLKSHRTGAEIEFRMHHVDKCGTKEDILAWRYLPLTPCGVNELVVYND